METKWRILGVDNGTSQLGLALLEYDFMTDSATVIDLDTLTPKLIPYRVFSRTLRRKGTNAARREWMKERLGEYIDEHQPHVVAIETPFVGSMRTISSFEPLALSVDGLVDEVLDAEIRNDILIDIEKVAPHQAKRAVMLGGTRYDPDKAMVKINIRNHPCIHLGEFNMDDHEDDAIDGIAIAWTVVTRLAEFE